MGGQKGCRDIVNAVDTAYNMSTPLIEASRTIQGNLNDNLRICKLLVEHGAIVSHTDARKENCLHWAVRRKRLPIVRYFVQHSSEAVEAASAANYKKKIPLDMAQALFVKEKSAVTEDIERLLTEFKKGMNFRLKIQKGKTRRLEQEEQKAERQRLEQERVLEETRVLIDRVHSLNKKAHDQAEQVRQRDLGAAKQKAAEESLQQAKAWLSSKAGQSYLKTQVKQAMDECKKLVKQGKMKKSRNLKTECTNKIKAHLFAEKELEAETKAEEEFETLNPPIFHEERLYG